MIASPSDSEQSERPGPLVAVSVRAGGLGATAAD
jgi:hypothetical protein